MHQSIDKRVSISKKCSRFLALLLLAAVVLPGLSGCSSGSGETSGSGSGKNASGNAVDAGSGGSTAKGRYVEEDMELPIKDGEEVLNLSRTEDGSPVLFASFDDTRIKRYEYTGQQWEETVLEWFDHVYPEKQVIPMEVQETPDGTQYVRGVDEEQSHIAKGGTDGSGEDLLIPYLSQQGEFGYPLITGMAIDGSGHYWLQNPYEEKCVVIAGDTMEVLEEINIIMSFTMLQRRFYQGEDTLILNTEENVYTIYNENLEQQGTFSVEGKGSSWMCSEGGHWYQISEEGIICITPGNEIQELIMDGSMGAMGSAVNIAAGFVVGKEDDFYILYCQKKAGTYSLKHAVYDPDVTAVPEQTLQVFGLKDNDTIREAAVGFQKSHPNVKVEFTTSGKEAGEITSDDIRTLNTELLSGNGADILLLDGLPKDAYIEKGILENLTETAEELMETDTYLEPLLKNTVQKDGKIYGLPIKFNVPVIFGNEDTKKALESLDSLKAFLKNDPEASVFGITDRDYIRDFLFQMYQEEIFGENGKVNQEKLSDLLELEGKIAVNAKASLFDADREDNGGSSSAKDPFSNAVPESLLNHPEGVSTSSLSSISDMMIPYTVMREKNLKPDTIHNLYQPCGVAGINQNTEQMETAIAFVKYLFSEEVQSTQLDDGFPVLETALQDKKSEVDTEYAASFYMVSSWNFEGEELMLEAGYPTLEEVKDLIRLCGELTTPAEQERILWNLYQEEADQYLGGAIDAQTAAENIARKVDTYLAE